ncbi:Fanconi anemia group I protein, partial [Orchesella cincta]
MVEGLRELAIGLLNADTSQNKYPNTLEKCRTLGAYLIRSIVKSCAEELPAMMKHLLKVSSRSSFHTECLAGCLEMRTRQIIQPSIIGRTCEIIRHLPMMDSDSASLIVKALSNAFHLNYMLLDQLMLNLRKTIWKSVEARRTAARIMIILLSNSKVVGDIPFSQYSESQRMQDSQGQVLSLGQIPDQQPLCMEILTLTKRCFNQQCEIRKELYLGIAK